MSRADSIDSSAEVLSLSRQLDIYPVRVSMFVAIGAMGQAAPNDFDGSGAWIGQNNARNNQKGDYS